MTIDMNNFYSGGYLLIRAKDPGWGDEWRAGLLPDKLISLSECVGNQFKLNWGWLQEDRTDLLKFGIPETQVEACAQWCTAQYEGQMGLWSTFYSTEIARRFVQQFELATEMLYLIGVGLPHRPDIVAYYKQSVSSESDYGVETQIARQLPLDSGGISLGFEIVSCDGYGSFAHSWLCGGIHQTMLDLFSIRPNSYGLIDAEPEAIKVYEWIKEDEMKGHRSEPEPYFPWLLVNYPL